MTELTRNASTAPPAWSRPRARLTEIVGERAFSYIALIILTGGAFLIYSFLGGSSASPDASNPVRAAMYAAMYAGAGALVAYKWDTTKRALKGNQLAILVFLLPFLSLLWSVNPEISFRRATAHVLTGFLCIYLASALSPQELLRRLTVALLVGGLASFGYALIDRAGAIHLSGNLAGSWKGIYGHKNNLGRVAAIALIVAYFMEPRTLWDRRARQATLIVFGALLLLSQSKTNWLIVAGFAGLYPIIRLLRNQSISAGLRVGALLLVGGAVAFCVTFGAEAILATIGRDATLSGRTTLWRGVEAIVAEKYPVWGAGYGAFFTTAGSLWDLPAYLGGWPSLPNHAHSGYLNTRAELGLLGIACLWALIIATGSRIVKRLLSGQNAKAWTCMFGLWFLFCVNNFSESVSFAHSDLAWTLLLVAFAYGGPGLSGPAAPGPVPRPSWVPR